MPHTIDKKRKLENPSSPPSPKKAKITTPKSPRKAPLSPKKAPKSPKKSPKKAPKSPIKSPKSAPLSSPKVKVVNEDVEKRLTKKEFLDKAYNKLETVECGSDNIVMAKRLFSTGSVGWNGSLHSKKIVNKKELCVMYTINAVVMKSKDWEIGGDIEEEKPEPNKKNEVEKDKVSGGDIMTIKEFMNNAKELTLKYGNTEIKCKPKKMASGNVGWNGNSNTTRNIQYQPYRVLTSINITVKGSNSWNQE